MGRCLTAGFLLLLPLLAHADYCPNDPRTGGLRDLMLLYMGDSFCDRHHYKAQDLLPYVAYLDKANGGRPLDWFYDSFLFLTIFGAPSGEKYDDGATTLADWRFYLDLLFDRDLNLHALDEAVSRVAVTLGTPPKKIPVMLMLPYMSPKQKNFGVIDDSGRSLDLSQLGDVVRCTKWFVEDTSRRFEEGHFKNLSLWGYYWMCEGVVKGEEERVRAASQVIHDRNYGLHWIPWSGADAVDRWRDLGFDFVTLQPNNSCSEDLYRLRDEQQFSDCGALAHKYGLGVEIEVAYRTIYGSGDRENLYDYLNHGLPAYEGYMSAAHGYYQTILDIARMYWSDIPADNRLYRALYAFRKQKYREHPACISQGCPSLIQLPGVRPTATLALTAETPASPTDAVTIPGSGGTLTLSFPSERRVRKVLLRVRAEGAGPDALASASAWMRDDTSGTLRPLASAPCPPSLGRDAEPQWWRLIGTPQMGKSLVVQFSGPAGGRLVLNQVRAIPPAEPGMDATCTTDGVGDGQVLTDREYAEGPLDAARLVRWPAGAGSVSLGLPDDRYMGTLWLHAVKPSQGQWPSTIEVTSGGRTISAELPVPQDQSAAYFPVKLPLALSGELQLKIRGVAEGREVAVDELELEGASSLALHKSYTFDPPAPSTPQTGAYPDDGKKLTDGNFAELFADGKLAGWFCANPCIVVDLGREVPVDSVRVHAWGGGVADTYFPSSVTVWTTSDTALWQLVPRRVPPPAEPPGAKAIAKAWLTAAVGGTARYVRLDLAAHSFLLLDEIEVISNGSNVARSRPYRIVGPMTRPPAGTYPDDGVRLTDGDASAGFFDRMKVAGTSAVDPTVTVDLGEPQSLTLAAAHVGGGGCAGVYYPAEMTVDTSLDGTAWTAPITTTRHPSEPAALLNIPFASPESRERTVGMMEVPLNTTARFVRWHFKRHGFSMIDEVEVYGN